MRKFTDKPILDLTPEQEAELLAYDPKKKKNKKDKKNNNDNNDE